MPAVRGLEDYLRSLEIVESRPLHELSNCIIGIDIFQWLRSNNFICRESLHSALGGLPITLEKQVHQQLFEFHKWRIQPLFVFNGLKYSQNARAPFSSSRSRKYAAKRKQAWKSMENNNILKSIDLFSQISGYVSISAQDDLIRIFTRWNNMIPQRNRVLKQQYNRRKEKEKLNLNSKESIIPLPIYYSEIAWFRAPYYAASQMAYLESQEEMLHAVCGGCDLLMFGGEKVILNIDFKATSYEVTDLDQVLYALGVETNPNAFIDTCLLSGFDSSRTFEPLTHIKYDIHNQNDKNKKRKSTRRNFSFEYSLEKVLEKDGNGIKVIEDYLTSFSDTGSNYSASSYNSYKSYQSNHSTKSHKSMRSIKSSRSVMSARTYQQNRMNTRNAGNIDKILQHMLTIPNEGTELNVHASNNINNSSKRQPVLTIDALNKQNQLNHDMNIVPNDDEKMENPKYKEYLKLYLIVRNRVVNAKVLTFNGKTKLYKPFKWIREQLKAAANTNTNNDNDKKDNDADNNSRGVVNDNDDITVMKLAPDYVSDVVYQLLATGILRTFLPSAILGGHLIDTTPLIDSEELEHAMNELLPLRQKILDIYQTAFNTNCVISLQRWFQPNRDKILNYNNLWSSKFLNDYKYSINLLFNRKLNKIESSSSKIALISPLKMLISIKKNINFNTNNSINLNNLPQINTISEILTSSYCGTLMLLGYIRENGTLSDIAKSLYKISKFEFETVLAIEMLLHNDLSEKLFTLIDENGKVYQIDSLNSSKYNNISINHSLIVRRRSLRLISRICCLLPMRPFIDGKKIWESKLFHSLAAFNHITTSYHNNIIHCIESIICWFYCNNLNNTMKSPAFLRELAVNLKELPPEPCIGMGVLITIFITNFSNINWNTIRDNTSDDNKNKLLIKQINELKKQFPVFTKINQALQCCMQFFYQICTIVKELGDKNILNKNLIIQFEDAYEYIRELGIWDAIYFMECIQQTQKHKHQIATSTTNLTNQFTTKSTKSS